MLVAIAIPVFTSQLEKSREATDAANIRSAYAEAVVKIIDDPQGTITIPAVELKQKQDGWQNSEAKDSLDSLETTASDIADLTVTVDIDDVASGGTVTFTFTPGDDSTSPLLEIEA